MNSNKKGRQEFVLFTRRYIHWNCFLLSVRPPLVLVQLKQDIFRLLIEPLIR